jgi:hypothetical protein
MTRSGMYRRQDRRMMNIELARILLADREREIEAALRVRRQLRTDDTAVADQHDRRDSREFRSTQRPASTGATAR